ncbi:MULTISPECIES: ion transporter [unclassified Streptosporangium]|uniref:ion transporter n=1 Tax=unclassified Streptosporangium TaxID=2632669 RepID=UPI002E283805|nr:MULTISPECIES: ion transporter [unclassified Streptosporangium]
MPPRERLRRLLETNRFQQILVAVIVINAATLGLETSVTAVERYGTALTVVDHLALYIFVAELAAKLYAYGWRFFRNPWNLFDTAIVVVSLLPTAGGLSVLRALRILRALRLISVVPSLRRVVTALLTAMPGMSSIVLLLALVLYVTAVMGTKLYHLTAPEYFGDLPTSLFTLFQMMTGDAWSDITREVMAEHPSAWVFFVVFMLVCTFVVLNLFIAVVVSAMEEEHAEESVQATEELGRAVLTELATLRAEVRELRDRVPAPLNGGPGPAAKGGTDAPRNGGSGSKGATANGGASSGGKGGSGSKGSSTGSGSGSKGTANGGARKPATRGAAGRRRG